MTKSYGILVYKEEKGKILVLLAHPGGPFWEKKDLWSIPKGEYEGGEDEIATAKREFSEETGIEVPAGELIDLGEIAQSSAKINHIWALKGDPDITGFTSNTFVMQWPPHSGKSAEFPEMDRIEWFEFEQAKSKLFKNQQEFLSRLEQALKA